VLPTQILVESTKLFAPRARESGLNLSDFRTSLCIPPTCAGPAGFRSSPTGTSIAFPPRARVRLPCPGCHPLPEIFRKGLSHDVYPRCGNFPEREFYHPFLKLPCPGSCQPYPPVEIFHKGGHPILSLSLAAAADKAKIPSAHKPK
jgi:hypothetical protein